MFFGESSALVGTSSIDVVKSFPADGMRAVNAPSEPLLDDVNAPSELFLEIVNSSLISEKDSEEDSQSKGRSLKFCIAVTKFEPVILILPIAL